MTAALRTYRDDERVDMAELAHGIGEYTQGTPIPAERNPLGGFNFSGPFDTDPWAVPAVFGYEFEVDRSGGRRWRYFLSGAVANTVVSAWRAGHEAMVAKRRIHRTGVNVPAMSKLLGERDISTVLHLVQGAMDDLGIPSFKGLRQGPASMYLTQDEWARVRAHLKPNEDAARRLAEERREPPRQDGNRSDAETPERPRRRWDKRGSKLWPVPALDGFADLHVWVRGNGTGLVRVVSRDDNHDGAAVDLDLFAAVLRTRRTGLYVAELSRDQVRQLCGA